MGKSRHPHHKPIQTKQARLFEIRRMFPGMEGKLNGNKPSVPVCDKEEDVTPKAVLTLNWDDERISPLVPRLLRKDECPQFTGILRDYVNCTAKGVHPDPELSKELDQFPPRERTDAFKEGCRRWHTFSSGKERL